MKAILMSIKPKWIEKIASGEKTVEVRKSVPKCGTPFKVYMYCTNDRKETLNMANGQGFGKKGELYLNGNCYYPNTVGTLNGKVVGEFVCDNVRPFEVQSPAYWYLMNKAILEQACLTKEELHDYIGEGNLAYGLHISDLKIYDKPKELREFYKTGAKGMHELKDLCDYCPCEKKHATSLVALGKRMSSYSSCDGLYCEYAYSRYKEDNYAITRPPQSWCYVEEL